MKAKRPKLKAAPPPPPDDDELEEDEEGDGELEPAEVLVDGTGMRPDDGRPVITAYPEPTIFASGSDAPPETRKPLEYPVEEIVVRKRQDGGVWSTIGWHTADDLPDEKAVLKSYGPGQYQLWGKNKFGQIVRRRTFSVGDQAMFHPHAGYPLQAPPAAQAFKLDGAAAVLTAVLTPIVGLITAAMKQSGDRDEERQRQVAEANANAAKAQAEMMKTITTIFAARVQDVENASTRRASAGASKDEMLELIAIGREMAEQSEKGGDLESAITAAVEGWAAAQKARASPNGAESEEEIS